MSHLFIQTTSSFLKGLIFHNQLALTKAAENGGRIIDTIKAKHVVFKGFA